MPGKIPGKARMWWTMLAILVTISLTLSLGLSLVAEAKTADPNLAASGSKTGVVEPDILWQQTYGDDDLFAHDVIETVDGNFTVTGEQILYTPIGAREGGIIFLLKANGSNGDKISYTRDRFVPGRFYSGEFVQQTKDGGYVVAGSGTENPFKFFYLVKYDENGNILWDNRYRPVGGNSSCTAATVTPDGGYLLIGYTIEPDSATYAYVVKTDSLGNKQWDTIIKDPAGLGISRSIPRSVTNAPGGYAITGEVLNDNTNLNEAFLLRLNTKGKVITAKHYLFDLTGASKTELDGASIQYTKDGFIIAGRAYGYGVIGFSAKAAFLLKVTVNGNVQWYNTYGRDTFSGASSVAQTGDGGYILTGTTDFYTPGSAIQTYIARTDSSGNLLWSKKIDGKPIDGIELKYATSTGNKIKVTSDGGYIVAGMAVPGGVADVLLVRLEPDIVSTK